MDRILLDIQNVDQLLIGILDLIYIRFGKVKFDKKKTIKIKIFMLSIENRIDLSLQTR